MNRRRSTVLERPRERQTGRVPALRVDRGRRQRGQMEQPAAGVRGDSHAFHAVVWDTAHHRAALVVQTLEQRGHGVHRVGNESEFLECVSRDGPDVAIIAWNEVKALPRALWQRTHVAVICYGGLPEPADRVRLLDHGLDDVVPMPLSLEELEARVRSVLRRTRRHVEPASGPLVSGDLSLDAATSRVRVRGSWVDLTALESKLLGFLMRHPAQAFSRAALLEHVWGFTVGDTSTVSVHIRRLRMKLEKNPARPAIVKTVWGVGYYLDPHAR